MITGHFGGCSKPLLAGAGDPPADWSNRFIKLIVSQV